MNLPLIRALSVTALLAALASSAAGQVPLYAEGGYADRRSVAAGGTIAFHIATAVNRSFNVDVVNLAQPNSVLQTITGLTSAARDCTGLSQSGCGWPVTTRLTVPAAWKPGYYAARFDTTRGVRNIIFAVKASPLGSYSPIAVIQTTNTYAAYNDYGGKSLYDSLSTNRQRVYSVSFDRPYVEDAGLSRFRSWEQPFLDFMTREGRKFEVITDDDIEAGVDLSVYKTVFIVGHSEYWSFDARQRLEAFSRAGGHLAILGGNTMWWQSRTDLAARQLTSYKDANLDPLKGVRNQAVTVSPYDWPVFNPENLLLGASFRNAGFANKEPDPSFAPLPAAQRTPYTVRNPSSWVFAGTGVTLGSQIAQASGGIEVDGAVFNTLPSGAVVVDGSDGTPLNLDILATLPAADGYGTIGIYTNPQGGAVFNAGTRDWTLGLVSDPVVQQMTRNVLDRFATGQPLPYVARTSPNRVEELFNTPLPAPGRLEGWQRDLLKMTLSSRCAREGPTGLELTGVQWTQILRNFAVNPAGLSTAALNVWVNADLLQQTPDFATPIIALVNMQGRTEMQLAALEVQILPEGRSIRLATFRANGTRSATTQWVVLSPGWHSVRMSWTSPGTVELNVSGRKVTAFNPESGQSVNQIMVQFAGSSTQAVGSVCIDALQLRETYAPASAVTSTITASPTAMPADGRSTSTIVIQLKDAAGDDIINGGDNVTVSTTRGTVSTPVDLGDGRYQATLTSSINAGTATISATVNGAAMTNTATVTLSQQVTSLLLSAPASATAGEPFTVTVTARDAAGNPTVGYNGTVRFTSNSGSATLPADYTFVPADNGVHQFPGVIFRSIGIRTITVTDGGNASLTSSAGVKVQGRTSTSLVSSVNPSKEGSPVTLTATVSATALGGAPTGSVTFRSGATVIGTAALSGTTASLTTSALSAGTHELTARYDGDDDFFPSTSAAVSQTVIGPASGSSSTISAAPPSIPASGSSTALVTVQLSDGNGNRLTSGGDAVVLATTLGSLSPVSDNGDGTYTATLTSGTVAGTATITGTVNGAQISSSATVTFVAGTAVSLTMNAPAAAMSGRPFVITVTARDANGNAATSYAGTIHFTSLDSAATLPPDYAFQPADNGTQQFTVTLRTTGNRSITATDVANSSISASATLSVQVSVLPPPAAVNAATVNSTTVAVTWSAVPNAATYAVERSFNGAPFVTVATVNGNSYQDGGLAAGISYLYRIRARDGGGNPGDASAVVVATTIQFVDDPSRIIRAADFNSLRTAIDAFRRSAGLPPAAYTNAIAPGAPVRAADLTEMRAAADAARGAIGLAAFPYGEAITARATPIRILHLHEIQRAIGAIPGG